MTFVIDLTALLDRAAKRAAQHGYQATPTTRLPEQVAEGSRVAAVARYPVPDEQAQGSQVATVAGYPASEQGDADDRRLCLQCLEYRPRLHRCTSHRAAGLQSHDIAPALAKLLQRCPGWKGKP